MPIRRNSPFCRPVRKFQPLGFLRRATNPQAAVQPPAISPIPPRLAAGAQQLKNRRTGPFPGKEAAFFTLAFSAAQQISLATHPSPLSPTSSCWSRSPCRLGQLAAYHGKCTFVNYKAARFFWRFRCGLSSAERCWRVWGKRHASSPILLAGPSNRELSRFEPRRIVLWRT